MEISLALGGGGVRGLAHVPALEIIDATGLKPSVIAGTSMGAIIGALYASGQSGRQIRSTVEEIIVTEDDGFREILQKKSGLLRWLSFVQPSWKSSGLLKVDGFLRYLLKEIRAETFEELEIPLKVTATDFGTGELVVFDSGPLMPAIRASMSIPGVFVPVEHEGHVLVDGGVINNLPFDLLPDDTFSIAIDVSPTRKVDTENPPNAVEAVLAMFDLLIDRVTQYALEKRTPMLYVRPELVGIPLLDFDKISLVWKQAQPSMDVFRDELRKTLE